MLREWPAFEALAKSFAEGGVYLRVAGLTGSARALAVAELLQAHPRPALVVVGGLADAHRWTQDLKLFGATALEFPPPEPRLWRGGHHREADAERAVIARRLTVAEPVTVVATPAALVVPLWSREEFAARTLRLSTGDRLDRELLLEALERCGYEKVETVVTVGQWSLRGGIVDVFSPSQAGPARLEFLGDDIESIRLFDPTSQRSVGTLDELLVLPLTPEDSAPEPAARLLDYLPAAAPVLVDLPKLLDEPTDETVNEPPLRERLAGRQIVELSLVAGTSSAAAGASAATEITLETQEVPRFTGRFNQLTAEIARWRVEGFRVRLTAADERQAEHVRQILREHQVEAEIATSFEGSQTLAIVVGECSTGFAIPALGVIVLTEGEVFGSRRRSLRRPKYQRGAALTAFTDLAPGDIIVHEDHGLGRYLGLQTMKVGDRESDFLLLEYSEGNRLYLPVERLELISKYLGGDAGAARLDRLGGASWQRVKESVRAALREMAEGLLRLYAQRAVADGHAFAADTPWQREFEAAFRFEETADQLKAIEDAKRDMETGRPMDRLVAGDVGYGKTEVALRAAFKAVGDGMQVAVLVPTTVLAQQHWATFADRFGPFPAKVELLSRFRSPKEQKAVVEGLRQGTVDVVIGTHRLLSKDVAFKNLGLMVIDEEHRFGVAHKERMKQLRASVDVLALTATPIPRTLYMSLSGVRDMSVIETAPLYQLRGRVGRERQQAYAYLLVPADGRVDEQAQRRLRALQELTELGSGFKLAMRDLEIRGAGNLLGAQQHGHIAAVGYDLYSKLLAEAVRELAGHSTAAPVDPVISVAVEGFLSDEYVPEVNQRLALYKRLAGAASEAEVADLRAELADRFGPLPAAAEQLLDIVRIRVAARAVGIEKVEAGDGKALVTFSPGTTLDPEHLVRAIQRSRGRFKMKREFTLEATILRGEWPRVRDSLLATLADLGRA